VESMRKLIVLSFLTLDGVIQGSGKPEEDTTGGFTYGGWVVPLFDDSLDQAMSGQLNSPFDLVLGRKTYEMFAAHWPPQNSEEDPVAASLNTART
jgi:dihydrofolate reductase